MTETVVLTVGSSTNSSEAMSLDNSLKTFTLRSSDNVYILYAFENVSYSKSVTEIQLLSEVCLKLDKLALRCGSCLFKVAFESLAGVLFSSFVIGKLYSGITIFLNCTNLRNYTWTSLNNGAWNILSIGTENGSHSDFLSN